MRLALQGRPDDVPDEHERRAEGLHAIFLGGDRAPGDGVTYSDVDLELKAGSDGARKSCHRDGSPYPVKDRS